MKIVKSKRMALLAIAGIMICQIGFATVTAETTQCWADKYINGLTQMSGMPRTSLFNQSSDILVNKSKIYVRDTFSSKIRCLILTQIA